MFGNTLTGEGIKLTTAKFIRIAFTVAFLTIALSGCRTLIQPPASTNPNAPQAGLILPAIYIEGDELVYSQGKGASRGSSLVRLFRVTQNNNRYRSSTMTAPKGGFNAQRWNFRVQRKAVSSTSKSYHVAKLKLPSAVNDLDACYVLEHGGRIINFNPGFHAAFKGTKPADFLISLRPYLEQKNRQKVLVNAQAGEERARRAIGQTKQAISDARNRLVSKFNALNRSCRKETPVYPAKPRDYMSFRTAKSIAFNHYLEFLVEKYKCTGLTFAAKLDTKEGSFERGLANFVSTGCDLATVAQAVGLSRNTSSLARRVPRHEFSGLLDIWEVLMSRCALEGDVVCAGLFLSSIALRAKSDIENMARRYYTPTREWNAAVKREDSRVSSIFGRCKSDKATYANRNKAMNEAHINLRKASASVRTARVEASKTHVDIFPIEKLQCRRARALVSN